MKNMSLSDFIIPLGLALLVIWGMNTYFGTGFLKRDAAPTDAWTFVAPAQGVTAKPLNVDIDFVDQRRTVAPVITSVETEWGIFDFSTEGATLESLAFKKTDGNATQRIYTVFSSENKSDRFFLTALEGKTPFYYDFVGRQDTDTDVRLAYRAKSDECLIEKIFIIDKNSYKIDLDLTLIPQADATVQVRVFFAAPCMPEIHQDVISGIVIDGSNKYVKTARSALKEGFGWIAPSLFGMDNKYYLHGLVGDQDHFLGRAYYKFAHKSSLIAILEGPAVDHDTTWHLSFYCGPKDADIMTQVDPRLAQAAQSHGWLSPLVAILLFLLKWLYSYVHNFGWAIILLTALMKLVLFPFTFRGERGMAKAEESKKKLAYLEQKFKHDPDRLALERAEFIKKHGLPGLSGCLPLLLQLPLFISLNKLLYQAPELYKAPFLWIPDLSATDPYYILPLLVFVGMFFNALVGPAAQRVNMFIFAGIFAAFTANFSAGLALYAVANTVLGVIQARLVKVIG